MQDLQITCSSPAIFSGNNYLTGSYVSSQMNGWGGNIAGSGCGGGSAPANTVLPLISGTPQAGSTLTASNGTGTNSPPGFAYQWLSGGSPISGATGSTYTPVTGDIGAMLAVTVTALNTFGNTRATSAAVGPVTSSGPVYACTAAQTLFQRADMAAAFAAVPTTPYVNLPFPGAAASESQQYFNDINTAVCAADTAGIYSSLDIWYLFEAPTQATALINLAPSGAAFDGVLTLTTHPMLFDAEVGFTGTESQFGANVTEYISTGFNPSTAVSPNFQINSAHAGLCVVNSRIFAGSSLTQFGALTTSSTNFAFIQAGRFVSGDNAGSQVAIQGSGFGGSGAFGTTGNGSAGYWNISRTGSANFQSYLNATLLLNVTASTSGAAQPTAVFPVGAENTSGTITGQMADTVGEFDSGGGLTSSQVTAFFNINHAYHANRGHLYC